MKQTNTNPTLNTKKVAPAPKMTEFEYIKQLETEHYHRIATEGETYYHSDEAKINGKRLYRLRKEYIKKHPTNYLLISAELFQTSFSSIEKLEEDDKQIYLLLGEGKYNEDRESYEKAIGLYEQANTLFFKKYGAEIKECEEFNHAKCGEQLTEKRLRICKNKLFKKETKVLEEQAKELENSNPEEAIEVYNELNELKPGLKKYNKRIQVCQNKLKKINK